MAGFEGHISPLSDVLGCCITVEGVQQITGKEVAEMFWGVLRGRGFTVMDGDWAVTTEPLREAWNEFAVGLNQVPAEDSDELLEFVLNCDEKFRQKLYVLMYNKGHRVHS